MNITSETNTIPGSQIEITGTLPWEDLQEFRKSAIEKLSKAVKIDGFRKGNVPEEILVKKVGEMAVLQEMAHEAMFHAYPAALKKHAIDAIGRPDIQITKLADKEELGFKITTTVMPEITLPDYKKVISGVKKELEKEAKDNKINEPASDKEVDDAILQLRKMRYQQELANKKHAHDHAEGEDCDCEPVPEIKDIKEEDVPALDDEYVKGLGEFKDVNDFKEKMRENMTAEKKKMHDEKTRAAVIEKTVEACEFDAPGMLVNFELNKMMAEREHQIAMSGMKFDDYLKVVKKTKEEMREDMKEAATIRTKTQLVLNKIAVAEDIEADKEKVDAEFERVKQMYSGQKDFDEDRARAYVSSVFLNQAVIEFLEKQG